MSEGLQPAFPVSDSEAKNAAVATLEKQLRYVEGQMNNHREQIDKKRIELDGVKDSIKTWERFLNEAMREKADIVGALAALKGES